MLQNNEEDCLLACYTMLLDNYNYYISLPDIFDGDMIPADGLSVSYLNKLDSRFKVKTIGFSCNYYQLCKMEKKSFPIILFWRNEHFVVLKKFRKNKWCVIDPAIGEMTYNDNEFKNNFSDVIVTMSLSDNFESKKNNHILFEKLKRTLSIKFLFLFIIALVMIQSGILSFSYLTQKVINQKVSLLNTFLLFIVIMIIQFVGLLIKNKSLYSYNKSFDQEYSEELFKNLLEKPLLFFRNYTNGSIIEKISLKSSIRDSITVKLLPSFISVVSGFIVFIYLYIISYKLTLIIFAILIFYFVFSVFIYKRQNNLNKSYLQYLIEVNSNFQTDIENIDYIKYTRNESEITEKWIEQNRTLTQRYSKLLSLENSSQFIGNTFNYLSLGIVIVFGTFFNNFFSVTIKELVLYQTGISILISSLEQIKMSIFEISRLNTYFDKQSDLFKNTQKTKLFLEENRNVAIKLVDVNFQYNTKSLYKNINLQINRGEKVAIIGSSGTGKTTLLMLIGGMIRNEGEIIYGIPNVEKQIDVVLQNMSFSKGSIYENINPKNVSSKEMSKVLKDTGALDIIAKLPKGIYSKALKSGQNLSGGQIQRLLIARSLLSDSELILWDEAFSNLDEVSKYTIYNNILSNRDYKSKTMVIISHQLDIIDYVDSVIFIDSLTGEVFKDQHNNLLKNNYNYKKFFEKSGRKIYG